VLAVGKIHVSLDQVNMSAGRKATDTVM